MNDARQRIFARLKTELDKHHNPTVRLSGADQRMKTHARGLVPVRGASEGATRVEMFVHEAEYVSAQVVRLTTLNDVPDAAMQLAREAGAAHLKVAPHPVLKGLDWPGYDVQFGIGHGDDLAGISMAYAGVAETGTLVLRSGGDTPTTLNFLPDVHMVVVRAGDIKACYEDVWDMLRVDGANQSIKMPRTVNWITGPSRTADIEQTILLGAHGPRKLVILLINEDA